MSALCIASCNLKVKMNEDINWDEIRSDDSLLRPAKLFEQGAPRSNAYGSSAFENSEGLDAPLLRDVSIYFNIQNST